MDTLREEIEKIVYGYFNLSERARDRSELIDEIVNLKAQTEPVADVLCNVGLSDAAIDILRERKGFRHWWDNIDAEMQLDIHASLHERFLQITGT